MARSEKKMKYVPAQKTGVIYARYSSHNQKEESIEQQIEECMSFAALNNIKITHVYADKAISGRTDKRPQFQHLMRDAEKREFSVVIAYKSNRIARDMLNALKYEDRLGKYRRWPVRAADDDECQSVLFREHGRGHQARDAGQRGEL